MNFPAILNIIGHVIKYELLLLLIPFFILSFIKLLTLHIKRNKLNKEYKKEFENK